MLPLEAHLAGQPDRLGQLRRLAYHPHSCQRQGHGREVELLLVIGNDLPWLGLTLSLHSCADSSLWDSHHNPVLLTNSESFTQTNHTTSKCACRPHQKLGRPQATRQDWELTVSASTKRVGHSEQEVSIWEELTNLDPIPRRLSPR